MVSYQGHSKSDRQSGEQSALNTTKHTQPPLSLQSRLLCPFFPLLNFIIYELPYINFEFCLISRLTFDSTNESAIKKADSKIAQLILTILSLSVKNRPNRGV